MDELTRRLGAGSSEETAKRKASVDSLHKDGSGRRESGNVGHRKHIQKFIDLKDTVFSQLPARNCVCLPQKERKILRLREGGNLWKGRARVDLKSRVGLELQPVRFENCVLIDQDGHFLK